MLFFSFFILILGIFDDFLNLKAKTKLIMQIIIVGLAVYYSGIKIENLGNLFGIYYTFEFGYFSIPFTILAVVGFTNAINMIDGTDGQAAILSIIAIIGTFLFNLNENGPYIFNFLLAILGGLTSFLIFNTTSNNKFKTFLGDGGSLFLGFVIAMVLIYCSQNIKIFSSSFALWCVLIPVFDFFCVLVLRKIEKRSLVVASRDHIHHLFESFNLSKTFTLLLVSVIGGGSVLLGYYIENNYSSISFAFYTILFIIYLFIRIKKRVRNNI